MNRCTRLLLLLVTFSALLRAQDITPVIAVDTPPNTAAQQAKHYVVLVSLDGFRYDYPAKYGAPHLLAIGAAGASAPTGMLPSYPSLTFSNHISLITGLYPEHHGIVANNFYDPVRKENYAYTNQKNNNDGSWYSGTPLWALAEQQGMRAASMFWPGSEADIQGKRPAYYLHYDEKVDDHKRIDQIIAWLSLPPELRPHFVTLYYADVDHQGHEFGPETNEVRDAVHHTDDLIGELQARLAALHLPVDLIVVADHGMVAIQPPMVVLADTVDLTGINSVGGLLYPKTETDAVRLYGQLREHANGKFSVYRRADLPAQLHFNESPRTGDPVIVANGPFEIRATLLPRADGSMPKSLKGNHGFDPIAMPEMKAIFFAAGPDIRHGVILPTFENVDVYLFVAKLLGLNPPPVDGKLGPLAPALATQPMTN